MMIDRFTAQFICFDNGSSGGGHSGGGPDGDDADDEDIAPSDEEGPDAGPAEAS